MPDVDELWLGLLDYQLEAELFSEGMEIVHSTMQAPMVSAKSEMKRKWEKSLLRKLHRLGQIATYAATCD